LFEDFIDVSILASLTGCNVGRKALCHNHLHAVGKRPVNGCIPNGMQRKRNRHFSTDIESLTGYSNSNVIFACLMLSLGSTNDERYIPSFSPVWCFHWGLPM